jgi:bifunctional non-homologous end joining protein LigD
MAQSKAKPLDRYKKKRNLKITPEPDAVLKKRTRGTLAFVVQKHKASHLHYDFRLECDGVLLSWAVPKGPSVDPHDKRLAIMVEDHPFDYRNFEGTIPEGNYGAGIVIVWDKGTYYPAGDTNEKKSMGLEELQREVRDGIHRGKLSFVLKGEKLQGEWALVRLKGRGNQKQWLLIKHNDEYADDVDITKSDQSVLSGKTIEQWKTVKKK